MDAKRPSGGASKSARRFVIVGGGISGLATARHLEALADERGLAIDVTLLEAGARVGGLIGTRLDGHWRLETGPNGFLDGRAATLRTVRLAGLADADLVRADESMKRRFLFLGDRLREFPRSFAALVASDLLSWRGKLRLLAEPFIRRGGFPEESIAAFGRRRLGREASERLLEAAVTGILAGDTERLSLAAAFPRLADLERRHRSLLLGQLVRSLFPPKPERSPYRRGPLSLARATELGGSRGLGKLTAPAGGMRVMVDRLAESLRRPPIAGVRVRELVPESTRRRQRIATDLRGEPPGPDADIKAPWLVRGAGNDAWPADDVIVATPAAEAARLLEPLDSELAQLVGGIETVPALVVGLGYRCTDLPVEPRGFGWIAPGKLGRAVLGVIWSSAIFPEQAPEGCFHFRAILGGQRHPELLGLADDELIRLTRDELRLTLRVTADPIRAEVIRWPAAIPQYRPDHLHRLNRIDARLAGLPGLHLTGASYRGVAVNDCCEQGERLASRLLGPE
jgi:oxygen-dependent protoporphyrinogen oxidase